MRLPDLVAYQAAVQHPSTAFADPQLRAASVATGSLGLPRAVAGNFAVTYQLRAGTQQWAVRCFHREAADRASRYAAISQTLAGLKSGPLVPIEYMGTGVRVGQAWYPITKMAWLEGRPLNRTVENNLSTPATLTDIERRFIQMVTELRRLGIAHGDLQHGNVLVEGSGTLRLVDYDGMFVAALHGQPASESGDPNYQHPRRNLQFDAELDRFAVIVIVLALRALATAPRLWHTYNTGDNLLFRRTDFANPDASPLFRDLASLSAMRELSRRFARICQDDYAHVPTLDQFLSSDAARPTMSSRHVAVLNTLYAPTRRESVEGRSRTETHLRRLDPVMAPRSSNPRSWKLRRAAVQTTLAFSSNGQLLASADSDGRVTLRESATGKTERTIRLPKAAGRIRALGFTPTGDLLAVTADGPALSIWDVLQQRKRLDCSVSGRTVRGLALSSNAAWLAAGSEDGSVGCWKVGSGRLASCFTWHASMTALAVARDGHAVAGAGPRVPLTVWQLPGGHPRAHVPIGRGVASLAFAGNGASLAVGTLGGRLTIWDVRTAELAHEVPASTGPYEAVALSIDATAVAASGRDGSIWLRRLPRTTRTDQPTPEQALSATRVLSSSYRLFDWLRRVALL
jgi:WD40 repeat protein